MTVLYLDLASGISGDMFVGALLDVGADFHSLETELAKLGLEDYHLHARRALKNNIAGTKFDVHVGEHAHSHGEHHHEPAGEPEHSHHDHGHSHPHHSHAHGEHAGHTHEPEESTVTHGHHRTFADIRQIIARSGLSAWVKDRAIAVFARLAEAEGKIHGLPAEQVAFHEVGAVDSIVDIVGGCVALELLGKPRLLAGSVVEGTGWIQCAHGRLPIPAPATLAVLGGRGIPVTQCEEPHEMVTPTGASLLAELVAEFGPMQNLAATKIGYGLGTREHKTRPNVLRAILGEVTNSATAAPAHDWETDTVVVLETNLDDISSEVLGWLSEQAFAAGALDVFHTPIQMKKNRPAVLLTLLCAETDADKLTELILRQTTSFGVRRHRAERRKLRREFRKVATVFGEITVKLGRLDGQVIQAAPEYESCRQAAEQKGVPLKRVYEEANRLIL